MIMTTFEEQRVPEKFSQSSNMEIISICYSFFTKRYILRIEAINSITFEM